uniref:Uncharacterized protein n=1 Tax=Anguilla anguilla TaxID=7936 RepID=A0A0E9XLB5_ANGAN
MRLDTHDLDQSWPISFLEIDCPVGFLLQP